MTDIIKKDKPILELKPISKEPKEEVFRIVRAEIARFYADTRFKLPSLPSGSLDEDEMSRMVNETTNDILTYASHLRLFEIVNAFKKGTRGMYGEYHGGSVATFNKFILGYLSSGEREQIVKKERKQENIEMDKPTPEQWDEKCTDRLKQAFNAVKNGEYWDDPGNYLYNWLDEKGLIPFSTERKKQFMSKAKDKLIAEQKDNKIKETDFHKIGVISKYIRDIESGNQNQRVIVMAKKIALNTLIRESIELGKEYKDLLK